MTKLEAICRCGYEGVGEHPCHAGGYNCRKPATQRFYDARPAGLPGTQIKLSVNDTWACDECWENYLARYK